MTNNPIDQEILDLEKRIIGIDYALSVNPNWKWRFVWKKKRELATNKINMLRRKKKFIRHQRIASLIG